MVKTTNQFLLKIPISQLDINRFCRGGLRCQDYHQQYLAKPRARPYCAWEKNSGFVVAVANLNVFFFNGDLTKKNGDWIWFSII